LARPVQENASFTTVLGVPQYRIGPGDVLEVLISRGPTQERQTVVVRTDGAIALPVGNVSVGGRSAEQAAGAIERFVAQFYRQPRVEVLVKEFTSKKITVLGAVGAGGGVVPLTGRTTLNEALVKAGGFRPTAALEAIQIRRGGRQVYTVNLFQALRGEEPAEIVLDAGDLVYVPERAAAEEQRLFVFGEVKSPGAYPYTSGMRLSRALALAGGPTDVAVFESARIIRGTIERPQLLEADFERVLRGGDLRADLVLEPSDIIYVPRSAIGNWNAFLAKLRPTLDFITLPLTPSRVQSLQR
jgi:polysaccharide export outer membrane protein